MANYLLISGLIHTCLVISEVNAQQYEGKIVGFWIDGNEIYEACQGNRVICQWFITALSDTNSLYVGRGELNESFCSPRGITVDQLTDIFLQRLERHPENRHQPAALIATDALISAFPCQ